ncbi:MAG: hypothetical protein AB8C95_06475 [Phycisphaeraceae bacterium]
MDHEAFIQAYLDGELTEQQQAEMSHWLTQCEANREAFVRASMLDTQINRQLQHADLHRFLDQVDIHTIQDVIDESPSDESGAFATAMNVGSEQEGKATPELELSRALGILTRAGLQFTGQKLQQYALPLGLAAAVVLAATLLFVFQGSIKPRPIQAPPDFAQNPDSQAKPGKPASVTLAPAVATITATHNAKWDEQPSESLRPGERFSLIAGFVEITTKRGAVAIVEAPATIELIENDNAIRLHAGKLVGICITENSQGFLVSTTNMDVIDLGTRFGVQVSESTGTQVHVFNGEVELDPVKRGDDEAPTKLTAGQSAWAPADTQQIVTDHPIDAVFTQYWQALSAAPRLEGSIQYQTAIPMVLTNGSAESHVAQLFPESFGVRLDADQIVTLQKAGQTKPADRVASTLPAGLMVDSYLIHYDQTTPPHTSRDIQLTIRFDRPILGVMATVEHMQASHAAFGVQGVTYATMGPPSSGARFSGLDDFLDVDAQDQVQISDDRKTLTLAISTLDGTDQIRVLVQADEDTASTPDQQDTQDSE